jgi:hypothetical protein
MLVNVEKSKRGFTSFLKKHNVNVTSILKTKEIFPGVTIGTFRPNCRGYFTIILSKESEVHKFEYSGPIPIRFDEVIECLISDSEVTEDDIEDMGYDFKEGLKVLRACQKTREKMISLLGSIGKYENFRDKFRESFPDL